MNVGFKDLLFYPDTFFKNIAQEKVNLIPPVIIVAGGCAISLSGVIVPFGINTIHNQVSDNPLPLIYFGLIPFVWALVRCYVLWPFLGWVLVSGALYLISRLFSKVGSFFATLQNVGYGLVPWVISNLVSFVATSLLYNRSHFYTSFWLVPSNVSAIIFIVFMLWCCCIWVYAIKHTHQIPLRIATVVVVIAAMAYFFAVYLGAYFPSAF